MNEKDIAFMGKITAGITHEMNNVLAIIRESAGLMEDIFAISKEGPLPHKEKLDQALARIEGQVSRGVELNKELNRFAHSMDSPEADLKIDELLVHIQALNARFARIRQVELNVQMPSSAGQIRTNPFLLLQLFCSCLESCLEWTEAGGQVELSHDNIDGGPAIQMLATSLRSPGDQSGSLSENLPTALKELDPLAQALNVRLSLLEKDQKVGVKVVF